MFKDLTDSFKARLYDYNSSSFLSSFIISWIVINHQYVLIYFSDISIYSKTELLLEYQSKYFYSFCLYPLLFALFYIFIYPHIHYYFYTFTIRQKIKLQNKKNEIEKTKTFTFEQINELREKNIALENELEKKDIKITNLQRKIYDLAGEIASESKTYKDNESNSQDKKINFYKHKMKDGQDYRVLDQGANNPLDKVWHVVGSGKANVEDIAYGVFKNIDNSMEPLTKSEIVMVLNHIKERYNITENDIKVLMLLKDKPYSIKSMTPLEISNYTNLEYKTFENILKKLVEKGVVLEVESNYSLSDIGHLILRKD